MTSALDTRTAVAHLLRRAGFASSAATIDALAAEGYDSAVDAVCDFATSDAAAEAISAPVFDVQSYLDEARSDNVDLRRQAQRGARAERVELITWWLTRMVAAERPWREKLTLLWHDHFATSLTKVKVAALMYGQRESLYTLAGGRFDELTAAVARDPAMLIWLDGAKNRVGAPNENFARELLELFTLGHGAGGHETGDAQPYTEHDVADAARACTGWRPQVVAGTSTFVSQRHDAGDKTLLGVSGELTMDDVVAITTAHPSCAPHVVSRLWSRLARPGGPDDPVVRELASGLADDLDIGALLGRLYRHPEFLAEATRTALVKTPVEYVVGTLRVLDVALTPAHLMVLRAMGMLPFVPPDVSGWPANEAWLSTAAALERMRFATSVAATADLGIVADAAPAGRAEAVARQLGVEQWDEPTVAALAATGGDPRSMVTIGLLSPEYVVA